jgi:transcriptional regulator with XRE-family HTH domain
VDLRELRKARGLSQKALAEKAGMHWGQVQKLEAGTIRPENITLRTAVQLAAALEIPVEDLLK